MCAVHYSTGSSSVRFYFEKN